MSVLEKGERDAAAGNVGWKMFGMHGGSERNHNQEDESKRVGFIWKFLLSPITRIAC